MFKRLVLSVFVAVGAVQLSVAAPVFVLDGITENNVFFLDRGVVLRNTGNPNDSYGGLTGWVRVAIGDPDGAGGVILPIAGDVEIEIFQAQNVESPEGNEVWIQADNDRFQGYAAFQVQSLSGDVATGLQVNFEPLTIADPFGKLAAGEVLALFVDEGATGWQPNALTLAAAVASVTDGSLWGTFGFDGTQGDDGGPSDGYLYQRNDNNLGNPEAGFGWAALNVVQSPGNIAFTGVNDPTEVLYGGATLFTSLWAKQFFSRSLAFDRGDSLFQFQSNDPLVFAGVPEPASILVFGGLFAGFLGYRRLRRRRED